MNIYGDEELTATKRDTRGADGSAADYLKGLHFSSTVGGSRESTDDARAASFLPVCWSGKLRHPKSSSPETDRLRPQGVTRNKVDSFVIPSLRHTLPWDGSYEYTIVPGVDLVAWHESDRINAVSETKVDVSSGKE